MEQRFTHFWKRSLFSCLIFHSMLYSKATDFEAKFPFAYLLSASLDSMRGMLSLNHIKKYEKKKNPV